MINFLLIKEQERRKATKDHLKMRGVIFSITFLFFLSFSLVSSFEQSDFDFDYPGIDIYAGGNYSINTNNTNYLQGYTPTTLWNYYLGLFPTILNDSSDRVVINLDERTAYDEGGNAQLRWADGLNAIEVNNIDYFGDSSKSISMGGGQLIWGGYTIIDWAYQGLYALTGDQILNFEATDVADFLDNNITTTGYIIGDGSKLTGINTNWTYANATYYLKSNPFGFYNSTTISGIEVLHINGSKDYHSLIGMNNIDKGLKLKDVIENKIVDGDTIYLPQGIFQVTANILTDKDFVMIGSGHETYINSSGFDGLIDLHLYGDKYTFKDFKISGNVPIQIENSNAGIVRVYNLKFISNNDPTLDNIIFQGTGNIDFIAYDTEFMAGDDYLIFQTEGNSTVYLFDCTFLKDTIEGIYYTGGISGSAKEGKIIIDGGNWDGFQDELRLQGNMSIEIRNIKIKLSGSRFIGTPTGINNVSFNNVDMNYSKIHDWSYINISNGMFNNVSANNLCYSNGTNCQASGGNPFNQSLNTTDSVEFADVTLNGWQVTGDRDGAGYFEISKGDSNFYIGDDGTGDKSFYFNYGKGGDLFGIAVDGTGFSRIVLNSVEDVGDIWIGSADGGTGIQFYDGATDSLDSINFIFNSVSSLFLTPEYISLKKLHFFNNDTLSFGGGGIALRDYEIYVDESGTDDLVINATRVEKNNTNMKLINMGLNVTGNLSALGKQGLTGNYSIGGCWMYYSSGLMTSTNCSTL